MNNSQFFGMKHALKNGNRFYTSTNNEEWNDLVVKGFATKHPGWEEATAYFRVTEKGEKVLKGESK